MALSVTKGAASSFSTAATEANLVETTANPAGQALVSVNKATSVTSGYDLVELAEVVRRGDEGVHSTAYNKLSVIADQIKYLQEQARQVLEKAKRDSELHHAACNLVKKPGTIYYMYERDSGQKYLSLISPQEWGNSKPVKYHGGYRLELDRSWTPVESLSSKDEETALLDSVIGSGQGILRAGISMGSPTAFN